MASVVTAPCVDCKTTACVVVCPVDCFYEGEHMLFIHPEECTSCEACIPECPVGAIFDEADVPPPWREFIELNAEQAPRHPSITERKGVAGREAVPART